MGVRERTEHIVYVKTRTQAQAQGEYVYVLHLFLFSYFSYFFFFGSHIYYVCNCGQAIIYVVHNVFSCSASDAARCGRG